MVLGMKNYFFVLRAQWVGCLIVLTMVVSQGMADEHDLKPHDIHGISELHIEKIWDYREQKVMIKSDRFIFPAMFVVEEKDESPMLLVHLGMEAPLDVHTTIKPVEVANAAAQPMAKKFEKKGWKLGKLTIKENDELGKNRWFYQQEISKEKDAKIYLCGVVVKTERRFYCFHMMAPRRAISADIWGELLEGWKELDTEEKFYAEAYKNRNKFLDDDQKAKLKETLKSEWASELQIRGMREKLQTTNDRALRKKFKARVLHSDARRMRLIYHRLFTKEQKEKFDAWIAKRLQVPLK